jgi:hypothetical protein
MRFQAIQVTFRWWPAQSRQYRVTGGLGMSATCGGRFLLKIENLFFKTKM